MEIKNYKETKPSRGLERFINNVEKRRVNLTRLCDGVCNTWYGHSVCGTRLVDTCGHFIGYTLGFDGFSVSVDYGMGTITIY